MQTEMTTLTIRVSKSDYKAFKEACRDLGLKTSDAFDIFIKATIRKNRIPFKVNVLHKSTKGETTNIIIRLSITEKERFKKICEAKRLNSSESIRLYIKAVIEGQCIPFPVKL